MVSERIQRRIESLLDEADEAVSTSDWNLVREKCDAVLRFDPDNEEARAFLEAAERDTRVQSKSQPTATILPTATAVTAEPSHPSSFVAGRYRVERFLGEGGRKRVFLAHDTLEGTLPSHRYAPKGWTTSPASGSCAKRSRRHGLRSHDPRPTLKKASRC